MKISSVNNLNYIKHRQPNFEGVWGKTKVFTPDYDPVTASTQITHEAYYYPFLDEKKSQIEKQVNENSSSAIIRGEDGRRQLLIRNCKVCAPLPIKKAHFDSYSKADESTDFNSNFKSTHISVKDKFLNSGFDNPNLEQISAVNQRVVDLMKQVINRQEKKNPK